MASIFTSLPLNFYTLVSGCGCGFGFELKYKKYWRIDGFGEKRYGSADLHTPFQLFNRTSFRVTTMQNGSHGESIMRLVWNC